MGDRANVYLVDQIDRDEDTATGIYVYTHWSGYEWPDRLRAALEVGKGRWGDDQYLNRIVIRELFATLNGETGGGLSTRLGDNEHPIIVVNHDGREVTPSKWAEGISFADYIGEPRAYPDSEVA